MHRVRLGGVALAAAAGAAVAAAATAAATAAAAAAAAAPAAPTPYAGGYAFLSSASYSGNPWTKLQVLAENAATLPINRVWLAFFDPQLVYEPGSATLQYTGLGLQDDGDYGFAQLKTYIAAIQAGGVEVFLSVGGWDYGCWPYMFMYYSIDQVQNSPNQWKIDKYGGGDPANCVAANEYCYVCEDPDQNETLSNFRIWPEPYASPTWQAAVAYVEASYNASYPPVWSTDMVPGQPWTDVATGVATQVPGLGTYLTMGRDPYADMVYLAKDLGAAGIDLDWEEFWHADYYRQGPRPYVLPNSVYKFTAIARDVMLNIQATYPACKLSHAAGATGAWAGPFWGGNLKGVVLWQREWYPEVSAFIGSGANAGGFNAMTYDMSDDEAQWQCPEPNACTLDQQVAFFMQTYVNTSIPAAVGYEIGIPAFPDPENPAQSLYALPLNLTALAAIAKNTQPAHAGGFLWELFKPYNTSIPNLASPTQVAQAICNAVMPTSGRCGGVIPTIPLL